MVNAQELHSTQGLGGPLASRSDWTATTFNMLDSSQSTDSTFAGVHMNLYKFAYTSHYHDNNIYPKKKVYNIIIIIVISFVIIIIERDNHKYFWSKKR